MAQVILLVADRAMRRSPAFEAARRTAAACGASIHVLLTAYSPLIAASVRLAPRQGGLAREGWLARLGRLLTQECEALRAAGLGVSAELIWSAHPAEEILLRARALRPMMIVIDAAAGLRGQLRERRLLRECPATLWLVRGEETAVPARVAVAVDPDRPWPSDALFNQQLLHTGLELARPCGADCELLYVARDAGHAARHPALDNLAEACGIGAGQRHALTGPVSEALTAYATGHGVGLLVIGGERRPRWKRLLLGNKVERINRGIGCDLLVVRQAVDAPATHLEPLALPRAA